MEVNSLLVVFITGTALPLIVSIVTKSDGSKGLKQAVTAAGSAVTAALATATTMDGTAIISTETLASALIAWVSAMAAYNGLYKPNSVNEKVLPGFGLGTSSSSAPSTSTSSVSTSPASSTPPELVPVSPFR